MQIVQNVYIVYASGEKQLFIQPLCKQQQSVETENRKKQPLDIILTKLKL